jgi:hypothetical protein
MWTIVLVLPEVTRKKPTTAEAGWVLHLKEILFFWLPALEVGNPPL